MGGCTFGNLGQGKTAAEAFKAVTEAVRYEHGRGGYSGTIAEKRSFTMIDVPKGRDPYEYARELIDNSDPRVDDKWGPAGCVKVPDGWYFFGWASS